MTFITLPGNIGSKDLHFGHCQQLFVTSGIDCMMHLHRLPSCKIQQTLWQPPYWNKRARCKDKCLWCWLISEHCVYVIVCLSNMSYFPIIAVTLKFIPWPLRISVQSKCRPEKSNFKCDDGNINGIPEVSMKPLVTMQNLIIRLQVTN